MTFGIIEAFLVLSLVVAIGVAIYAHTNAGKSEVAKLRAEWTGFVAGFHLGSSQPSTPIVADSPVAPTAPNVAPSATPAPAPAPVPVPPAPPVQEPVPPAPAPAPEPKPAGPPIYSGADLGTNLDVLAPAVQNFTAGVPVVYTLTGDGTKAYLTIIDVSGSRFTQIKEATLRRADGSVVNSVTDLKASPGWNTPHFTETGPLTFTVTVNATNPFGAQKISG